MSRKTNGTAAPAGDRIVASANQTLADLRAESRLAADALKGALARLAAVEERVDRKIRDLDQRADQLRAERAAFKEEIVRALNLFRTLADKGLQNVVNQLAARFHRTLELTFSDQRVNRVVGEVENEIAAAEMAAARRQGFALSRDDLAHAIFAFTGSDRRQ